MIFLIFFFKNRLPKRNNALYLHSQSRNNGHSEKAKQIGRLAQLVQSTCLTSRGSGVRIPHLPRKKALQILQGFFVFRKLLFMFYTYILYSKSTDTFYKGSTQDIKERIRRHNNKMEKATQSGAPWILLWSVEKQTKGEAQILEYKLKNLSRSRTCDFILKYNEGIGGPDELLLIKQLSGC